jgi:hypothetical protein
VPYPPRFVPHGLPARGLMAEDNAPEPRLATVVIPITVNATAQLLRKYARCRGPHGDAPAPLQRRVSQLRTLNELDGETARDAFWLGHTLGQVYGQAIECARSAFAGQACRTAPARPTVTCPSDPGLEVLP